MYESFYNLTADPFRLSPNDNVNFRHESYNHAKTYMQFAFRQGDGIVLVTGKPGTGKTALLKDVINTIRRDTGSVIITDLASTQLQADDLIRMIGYSFGLTQWDGDKSDNLHQLEQLLSGMRKAGHRLLLIIDEAQNLGLHALRKIESLVRLRWHAEPLIQIFLIGREGLYEQIVQQQVNRLCEQINAIISLEPLTLTTTKEYIRYRLTQVGWSGDPQLDDEIFPVIFHHSHGIPRLINLICSQTLLYGMTEERHHIGINEINNVIEQMAQDQILPTPAITLAC